MTGKDKEEDRIITLKKLTYSLLTRLTLKRCELNKQYLEFMIQDMNNKLNEHKQTINNLLLLISM